MPTPPGAIGLPASIGTRYLSTSTLDGELVDTGAEVLAFLNPFSSEPHYRVMPAGLSIADILSELGVAAHAAHKVSVLLEDEPVPAAWFARVRPKPGRLLIVRVIPRDGTLRAVLQIGIALAASAIGAAIGGPLGAIVAVGINFLGNLALNALIPPPRPNLPDFAGDGDPLLPTVTGVRNNAFRYGEIPLVLGRRRMFPVLAANNFTEVVGDDQFLRFCMVFGYGPLQISDIKIGDTPIEDFDEVEFEVRQGFDTDLPLTLYTNDVAEDNLTIDMISTDGFFTRTAPQPADELSVDLVFPGGLFQILGGGGRGARTVAFEIQYRPISGGAWVTAGTPSYRENKMTTVRKGLRWSVARDTYEVRVRRTTAEAAPADQPDVVDAAIWTALRAFKNEDPIDFPQPLAKIAGRIRASGQLNGVVDTLNAQVESILPVWDGATWTEQVTSNPAWEVVTVLTGPSNARALDRDQRLDLAAFKAWADENDAESLEHNEIIDRSASAFELIRGVAATGRGALDNADGKYTIVRDRPQTDLKQIFSARNSSNFQGERVFTEEIHGLRVRFINEEVEGQQDEILVFADGFDELTATKFDVLELRGVTSADQAWKQGRFHLADALLRGERFSLDVDFEYLAARRLGSLVKVAHDAALIGLGSARVQSVETDGGSNMVAVTVDEQMTIEAGKLYAARFRLATGVSIEPNIKTIVGDTVRLEFFPAIASGQPAPAVGDLMLFGERQKVALDAIITKLAPKSALTARVTMMPAAAGVYTADQGPIPPHDPKITVPPELRPPAAVSILSVQSDETVLIRDVDGSLRPRMLVTFSLPASVRRRILKFTVQFRASDGEAWQCLPDLPPEAQDASIEAVEQGTAYDVRIRAINVDQVAGDWGTLSGHIVVGKSTPPPDVATFTIADGVLSWSLPDPPPDLAGFTLRSQADDSNSWAAALPLHQGVVSPTVFILPPLPGGPRTFFVKALDSGGNESVNAARVVTDLGDALVNNVIDVVDHRALSFPGLITGGSVSGGDLSADLEPDLFWPADDNSPFWPADSAAMFWDQNFQQLVYRVLYQPPDVLPARLTLETEITGAAVKIEYRTGGDAPFWDTDAGALFWDSDDNAAFWGLSDPFSDWPGVLEANDQVYEFRVTAGGGDVQAIIAQLKFLLDVPDVVERFNDVVTIAGGSQLTPSKTFRQIRNVSVTIQDDGGDAVSVRVLSKSDPVLGPIVQTLDDQQAGTAGLIDAIVQGF